ncbi:MULTISPECIES: hypothetical protein [Rhizobium/Agrobacterium group]|uniref:Uncharacterized protein n=2 Tax=Neorhizobium TaxID=1525371 RepID=A0ABV0M336_9HYPH|nr:MULTISPECIES: hypothetical protein [Rhizobium/Agrobacterium group]MCC2609489.1 hypothetical protein [Neorhizobium petrolearium]WGI69697.1 hypothetical protein QEO92_06410 [Neorhizobium petrolearium]
MSPVRKRGLIIAMAGIPTLAGLLRVIPTGRIILYRAPLGEAIIMSAEPK